MGGAQGVRGSAYTPWRKNEDARIKRDRGGKVPTLESEGWGTPRGDLCARCGGDSGRGGRGVLVHCCFAFRGSVGGVIYGVVEDDVRMERSGGGVRVASANVERTAGAAGDRAR